MINLNICLSDIPEAKIYKANNGKQYITISAVELKEKDKYVSAILKRQNGNAVDQEQRMDSNIRILMEYVNSHLLGMD